MSWGDLAALGGALGWAISGVIVKSATVRVRALRINAIYIALGAAMGLVLAAASGRFMDMFSIGGGDSALLIGGALVGTTGDVAMLRSMTIGDLGRNFTTATAVFVLISALGGWLILDESVSGYVWGGGVLILGGVYLTNVTNSRFRPGRVFEGWSQALSAPSFALVAGSLWAASLLMYDAGLEGNDVIAANALSHLGPLTLVALGWLLWKSVRPLPVARRDGGRVVVSGLFFGAAILSFVVAINLSEASSTAVLISSSPLFMVPLSIAFLGERLTRRAGLGVAVTLAGVFLVVGFG